MAMMAFTPESHVVRSFHAITPFGIYYGRLVLFNFQFFAIIVIHQIFAKCIKGSTNYLGDKQDSKFRAKALRLELVIAISRRRAFARNVEMLLFA